ncbi:multidrug resistance efflux pump [Labrenzia sp. EL_159]|nr:multidrug resistance efflux pump [Labrenzia sp. EL_162]MBG6197417.1 multidrug resistance efflux pump [Labrenzia sp. EL_159]
MEIIHERPSQRLHYRVTAPMRVAMGAQSFDAVDWGLGGCRIAGAFRDLPEMGSCHTLLCTLPFQGFNITLQAEAEVVRLDEAGGEVAFRFVQLGEREAALMQHFVEDLVRGKMTDVADTIVRIDTPVTPVPTKPDPNPVEALPVRRWPLRQIVMTLFYVALGAAVFGYVGVYAFATLFRLEVESAVVTADRSTVTAPVAGRIVDLPQRTGALVTAGSLLAVLENTDRQDTLRRAKSELASTRAELAERQALVEEERRRAEGYALVAKNNVRQAESQLAGLALAKENASLKLDRVRALAAKGLILTDEVETAELSLKSVDSDLARKQIHIQELKELIDGGNSIRLFTGNAFAGRLAEMEARVARLKTEEDYQQRLVEDLGARETEQEVLAPTDGRLISVELARGNAVKQGAPLLVFEETGAEEIRAFLTQEEVLQVRRGSKASLYVPTENRWMSAEVMEIDRTAGFVDEVTETHRFRSPDGRSAQVTLRPAEGDLPSSGTPVTVYFERHRNNLVFRTLQQLTRGL